MKQERIEELLAGTEYEDSIVLVCDNGFYEPPKFTSGNDAGSLVLGRAILNAARVQLLAKALRDARRCLMQPDSNTSFAGMIRGAVGTIDAALAEAGLDKEPA